jgi:hypothetical protein
MAQTGMNYTRAARELERREQTAEQSASYTAVDTGATNRTRAFAAVREQLVRHGQEVRSRMTSASGINEIQRRFAARQWFSDLGHSVDDGPDEVTDVGRPRWRCRRCGSDLQLNSTGGWASSSGTGRCPHEGASW